MGAGVAEFATIEKRLRTALDRAEAAASRLGGPDEAALSSLKAELAAEREAAARLEAKVRELGAAGEAATGERAEIETARARAEEEAETLRAECARLRGEVEAQSGMIERLQKTSNEVTAAMKVLREAQTADLVDAHLIDKAMRRELDALHAARESERAEIDAIVAALGPLAEEQHNA